MFARSALSCRTVTHGSTAGRWWRRAASTAVVLVVVAGCGNDEQADVTTSAATADSVPSADTTAAAPATFAPNGEVVEVLSLDNNYIPQELTVVAGTEVEFFNNGRNDHNVIPEGDLEASSWGVQLEDFRPGDRYSHVFTTPGTYVYYCTIHGTPTAGMFGSIIVTEP